VETPEEQREPDKEQAAVEPTVAADPPTAEETVEPLRRDTDTWSAAIIGAPTEPPPQVHGDFPIVFRGYDRDAVEAHLAALEEEVIELHGTRSPQAAVKRELDRVGEETAAILKGAHEAADDIAKRSRTRADERIDQADREAERIRSEAEAHVRRLDRDTDELWAERRKLLEDARTMGETLIRIADEALERFPPAEDGTAPRPPEPAPPAPILEEVPPADDTPELAVTEAVMPDEDPDVVDDAESAGGGNGVESVKRIPRPDAPRHPRRPRPR
jgi:hypothetical protein